MTADDHGITRTRPEAEPSVIGRPFLLHLHTWNGHETRIRLVWKRISKRENSSLDTKTCVDTALQRWHHLDPDFHEHTPEIDTLPIMAPGSAHVLAETISALTGWLYTLAWSLSFYPQPLLNIRRKSSIGLTPDFPMLNVFGFACFTTSTTVFLFSPVIRSQYAARHPVSPEPTVRGNDLAFGAHALLLCVITYSQFWPSLWGWEKRDGVRKTGNRVSLGLVVGSLVAVVILTLIVALDGNPDDPRGWSWIDVVRRTPTTEPIASHR